MNNKHNYILTGFISLASSLLCSCNLPQSIEVKENTEQLIITSPSTFPLINDNNGLCLYLEQPLYIINADHVVYQDCKNRKVIYPDLATFKIPSDTKESGIAIDKQGIWFKVNLLKLTPKVLC